ncbi:MAG: hypothetical protein M0P13_04910, partial [Fibrobacteraceae bacterium]|nr:hypothetical protein [Fibrobacteraceae bacterium]
MKKILIAMLLSCCTSFALADGYNSENNETSTGTDTSETRTTASHHDQNGLAEGRFGFSILWLDNLGVMKYPLCTLVYDASIGKLIGGFSAYGSNNSSAGFILYLGAEKMLTKKLLPIGIGGAFLYGSSGNFFGFNPYFLAESEIVKNISVGIHVGYGYDKDEDN